MSATSVKIIGEHFFINGAKTYSEITGSTQVHGLLMNARFIQGIFDDKADRTRFNRFGKTFDADKNTDDLINAFPDWYKWGLRAFTLGLQGGGPCFTTDNSTIDNNPFSEDGKSLDVAYLNRLDRLIKAADAIGMVVIVSFFYAGQAKRLKDEEAVINAVKTASHFLRDNGYTNVLIEVANEHDIDPFSMHPIIKTPVGISRLISIAKDESGGIPVGCSGGGGSIHEEVCIASDYVLIHGNGLSRQHYYNLIQKAKLWGHGKPIVCNEDSQAIGQLEVAFKTGTSWGYYNNITKQEPPADWGITKGEDMFFAYRMAQGLGIQTPKLRTEDQYYLQGLEPDIQNGQNRWIRLSSLYPETIDYVDFYLNDKLIYTCYDEPFTLNFVSNWIQNSIKISVNDEIQAKIYLRDGNTIEITKGVE